MKIKKHEQSRSSRDRWLISYADFITLLFAFFVVMYAMSSVNQGKYRILSDALESAFKKTEITTYKSRKLDVDLQEENVYGYPQEIPLEILSKKLKHDFKALIKDGMVLIREEQDWIEIEIKSNLLFTVGASYLNPGSEELLQNLAKVLKQFKNPITVEGFTDNQPIKNDIFPSNWELSADRAASVVRLLIAEGLSSARLAATGYGANFPVQNNDNPEGRAANRRVVLLVERNNKRRTYLENMTITDDLFPGLEEQPEVVIEPQKPFGKVIKSITLPDGTKKYTITDDAAGSEDNR